MRLNVIHIGKCGGTTVRSEIKKSTILSEKFEKIIITHVKKPIYRKNMFYLIVIRNPISRAVSAYNWRNHLVNEEQGNQRNKKKHEIEGQILSKYENLSNMAEQLYDESGTMNEVLAKDFNKIGHFRKGISFYLSDLLEKVRPEQIHGVIKQHSISSDCMQLLGSADIEHRKNHGNNTSDAEKLLTPSAKKHLRRFLHKDFTCILYLYNLGVINWEDFTALTE